MCGISGIVGLNSETQRNAVIRKMNDCMAHRGPDADGFYVDADVALGHRRLSIIDLSTSANQPFKDNSERYVLVFNGEIYNFREIKARLKEYAFKTSGDTEVVIAAFEKWGPACLEFFKGMFALAIWDKKEKALFIARDRFGVKPLYYYDTDNALLFASEIRAVLASDLINRSVDQQALYDYLMFQSVVTPATLIKDIKQLPAGHYMIRQNGKTEIKKYWSFTGNPSPIEEHSYDDIKMRVRELLYKAVERRLVSDVPLGTFLSGGIDSSIIAGVMAETNPVQTNAFTISFDEKNYDESDYAELIAKKFNLNHTKVKLRAQDFLDELPVALDAMDSPSGDGLNTYVVSKAIRKSGIVVAMSGVGGDELFAGYPIFRQYLQLQKYSSLFNYSSPIRKVIGAALPGKNNKLSRVKQLLQLQATGIADIYPLFRQILSATDIKSLTNIDFKKGFPGHLQVALEEQRQSLKNFDLISQVSIADYMGYTQHVLLKDMDQMSMASSLEVREPFFDAELVEYVLRVPDKYKMGAYPKNLLVDASHPILPDIIINRRKQGFVLPYDHWIRNELSGFCKDKINRLSNRPIFNKKAVLEYWQQYLNKQNNIRWTDIWILIVLENWLQKNNVE
jgi:asparagine synthase (glutamine-hydrolysing)